MSTDVLLGEWAEWMRAGSMAVRTIEERVEFIQRFEATTGIRSLAADWRTLSRFLANDRFTPGTRQTYHSYFASWFGWLLLMDYRTDDPVTKLRSPKVPQRRARPVTVAQLAAMLNTRMHKRTRIMIYLATYQGLRVSEIARFRGSDLAGGHLRVVGKGGRVDYLPIHPLIEASAATMPRTGLWFPSHTKLGPINGKSVSAIISNVMKRAGVPGTPHALRHFYGTELLRSTGNIELVREMMRHQNIATTAIYTEVDKSLLRTALLTLPVPPHAVS